MGTDRLRFSTSDRDSQKAAARAVRNRAERLDRELRVNFLPVGRAMSLAEARDIETANWHAAGLPSPQEIADTTPELRAHAKHEVARVLEARLNAIHDLGDRLIRGSLAQLPHAVRSQWDGLAAIDATFVAANCATPRKWSKKRADHERYLPVDPHAGWYIREGDPPRWGYEMSQIIAASSLTRGPVHDFPSLTLGYRLHVPGVDPGGAAVGGVDGAAKAGFSVRLLAGDRLYTSLKPENYALPLHERGVDTVIDYKDSQLGLQAEYHGAILVEGTWYSPSMPEVLRQATVDYRAKRIDYETWRSRLTARRKYELAPHGKDRNGNPRYRCSAKDPNAQVQCPLSPSSLAYPLLPMVELPPMTDQTDVVHRICEQVTMVIPREVSGNFWQRLAYESEEWNDAFGPLRNRQEGRHGLQKRTDGDSLDDKHRRSFRGFVLASITQGVLAATGNVHAINSFFEEAVATPERAYVVARRTRKTKEDWVDIRHFPRSKKRDQDDLHAVAATDAGESPPGD